MEGGHAIESTYPHTIINESHYKRTGRSHVN